MSQQPCSVVVAHQDETTWSGCSFWILDEVVLDLDQLICGLLILGFKVTFCSQITMILVRGTASLEIQIPC